jgi:pimeloyl-ACP methyl ester carboxylesterase
MLQKPPVPVGRHEILAGHDPLQLPANLVGVQAIGRHGVMGAAGRQRKVGGSGNRRVDHASSEAHFRESAYAKSANSSPAQAKLPKRFRPAIVWRLMPSRPLAATAVLFRTLALIPLFIITGCAVVGVKVRDHSTEALRAEARRLDARNGHQGASQLLLQAKARGQTREQQLSTLIAAARLTADAPAGSAERRIYELATAQAVDLLRAEDFAPAVLPDGQRVTVAGGSKTLLDPRTADELIPAADVQIRKLRVRTVQDGAGVPYVARFRPDSPALRGQPGIPPLAGLCDPVTAVWHFDRRGVQLAFYRTRVGDTAVINGRSRRLAADFSAPLAYLLSKGKNRNIDIRALIRTDRNIDNAGLYQFSKYDPDKIPVVFVHGLMSRPETWVPAVNELLADRQVRERYQFWFFLYPTGLPVWASAAKLRGEIERFRLALDPAGTNPKFHRMVLAGHSMGGLISSLQIRTGGRHLWKQFMDAPPESLDLSPELKARIIQLVEFQPRPEIKRVVFFATPHRGSDLAVNPAAEFFARLIRLPFGWLQSDMYKLRQAVREDVRDLFVAPANSITFLRARSPLLEAILNLPMKPGVPYHSIIGDRGRGDAPESSDGVVPYWSSHLAGATSEKIVPSGHGTNENPAGIDEFRRILRKH